MSGQFSVVNAAVLITGNNPSVTHSVYDPETDASYLDQFTGYTGFHAVFEALKNAIRSEQLAAAVAFPLEVTDPGVALSNLRAVIRHGRNISEIQGCDLSKFADVLSLQREPDWSRTTVEVDELKRWLRSRNHFAPFFFPPTEKPSKSKPKPRDYMDKSHPHYSRKLACAVAAWEALLSLPKSKPTMDAIKKWVSDNGASYDVGKDGKVPINALEQIAKVVNWNVLGGAPETGRQVSGKSAEGLYTTTGSARQNQKMQPLQDDDEDMPPGL